MNKAYLSLLSAGLFLLVSTVFVSSGVLERTFSYGKVAGQVVTLPAYETPDDDEVTLPAYETPDDDEVTTVPTYETPHTDQSSGTVRSSVSSSTNVSPTKKTGIVTVPGNVRAENVNPDIIRIRWTVSGGGDGGIRYNVYRDGRYMATVPGTNYDDHSVEPGRKYAYAVEAVDRSKNVSGRSPVITALFPSAVRNPSAESSAPVILTVGRVPAPEKVFSDSDGDGLSDAEEERLGTESRIADTDGDGFPDGAEVGNGFDPLKHSPGDKSDKVVFESPKSESLVREDRRYIVKHVAQKEIREDGTVVTEISGKGLPNAYLTLYVYSDPIVVAVRSDSEGNWRYELDRHLEDGDHEVYVAVTDNLGRITAQSEPLPFTKTAEAITISGDAFAARASESGNRSPLSRSLSGFVATAVAIAVFSVVAAVFFVVRKGSDRSDTGL